MVANAHFKTVWTQQQLSYVAVNAAIFNQFYIFFSITVLDADRDYVSCHLATNPDDIADSCHSLCDFRVPNIELNPDNAMVNRDILFQDISRYFISVKSVFYKVQTALMQTYSLVFWL